MVVITVNGVYLDQAPSIVETDILMGFTRTFVLKPVKRKTVRWTAFVERKINQIIISCLFFFILIGVIEVRYFISYN